MEKENTQNIKTPVNEKTKVALPDQTKQKF